MHPRRVASYVAFACVLSTVMGCGMVRETLPERSALEQLLISTAADRAIARLPTGPFAGKAVFVDATNLECLHKPYVVQRIRQTVLESGASLAASREDADVALEAASGMLSVNKREYLLGLPAIPVPVPFAAGNLTLPELAIFKSVSYHGRAELIFSAVDTETNELHYRIPTCFGESLHAYWKALIIVGPFERSDLPKGSKRTKRTRPRDRS